jgi:diaminohydroxyphosphoribosylaminopyrimidine deaminase/5-amino-6-(5-phosphoribosylamino)uracil reductase
MFADAGVEVWRFGERNGRIDLRDLTLKAGKGGMTSLIIEGGGRLAAAALKDGIVDRVMIYVAPRLIGEGVNAIGQLDTVELDKAIRLEQVSTRRLGDDLLYTADVRYPCSRD